MEFHFVFSNENIDGLKTLFEKHSKVAQLLKGLKSSKYDTEDTEALTCS